MDPAFHQRILGSTFVNRLTRDKVFTFGGESFSRHFCVTVLQCGNFIAFGKLAEVLKELHCKKFDDILKIDPVAIASIRGIGETTLYSLLCYIEYKQTAPESWYSPKDDGQNQVTFSALKTRAMRADKVRKTFRMARRKKQTA